MKTKSRLERSFLFHFLLLGALLISGCTGQTSTPQAPADAVTRIPATQTATHTLAPAPQTPAPTSIQATTPQPSATPPPPVSDFPIERLIVLYNGGDQSLHLLSAAGSRQIDSLRPDDYDCPGQGVFSTDGKWLAYVSGHGLVMGQRESGEFAIVVSSQDLAAYSPPVSGGWIEPTNLTWIPASSQLLFTTIEQGVPFASSRFDLYRYDAETGALQRLLNNDQGGVIYPDPGGSWAALAQATRIRLLDLHSEQIETVLEYLPVHTHTEFYYIPAVDWLPDGAAFQTTIPPTDPVMNPQDPTEIWKVTAADGKNTKLGQIHTGFQAQRPFFSPDGGRLAYVYRTDLAGPVDVFLAQADGSRPRTILSGTFDLRGWMPGGRFLLLYNNTSRQFAGLEPAGSLKPLQTFGVELGGRPLAYRPLDGGLAALPRLLDGRISVCAWALLPPGVIADPQVTPILLPSPTSSPLPTPTPLPTHTKPPTDTPHPSATLPPGAGTYRELIAFTSHNNAVNALAFRPGADTLASADRDGIIYLWDLVARQSIVKMENPAGGVNGLAWSSDGKSLASAGGGSQPALRIWSGDSGQLLQKLDSPAGALYAVAFSPDGSQLAAAGKNGLIAVWNAADGSLIRLFQAHQGAIWGLVFSPDGQTIYSASSDQSVSAWSPFSDQPLWQENVAQRTYALALSRDGGWLAAGLEKGGLWLSHLKNPAKPLVFSLSQITVNSLAFHPSYPLLALGSDEGRVMLYDLAAGVWVNEWDAHRGWTLALAWSADGARLASAGGEGDNRVIIWDQTFKR